MMSLANLTMDGERQKELYESLDVLLSELPEAYQDELARTLRRVTSPDGHEVLRHWLRTHKLEGN